VAAGRSIAVAAEESIAVDPDHEVNRRCTESGSYLSLLMEDILRENKVEVKRGMAAPAIQAYQVATRSRCNHSISLGAEVAAATGIYSIWRRGSSSLSVLSTLISILTPSQWSHSGSL
jgi:hypothetical protein